jgi:hypothetical protein
MYLNERELAIIVESLEDRRDSTVDTIKSGDAEFCTGGEAGLRSHIEEVQALIDRVQGELSWVKE